MSITRVVVTARTVSKEQYYLSFVYNVVVALVMFPSYSVSLLINVWI